MNTVNDIIKAVKENDFNVVDDHNGKVRQLVGVGVSVGYNDVAECYVENVVALINVDLFCLNGINLKDGVPHLSKWSVGGTVDVPTNGTIQDAAAAAGVTNIHMKG